MSLKVPSPEPISDIEKAFGVQINDDDALELYDMTLNEALTYINKLRVK